MSTIKSLVLGTIIVTVLSFFPAESKASLIYKFDAELSQGNDFGANNIELYIEFENPGEKAGLVFTYTRAAAILGTSTYLFSATDIMNPFLNVQNTGGDANISLSGSNSAGDSLFLLGIISSFNFADPNLFSNFTSLDYPDSFQNGNSFLFGSFGDGSGNQVSFINYTRTEIDGPFPFLNQNGPVAVPGPPALMLMLMGLIVLSLNRIRGHSS